MREHTCLWVCVKCACGTGTCVTFMCGVCYAGCAGINEGYMCVRRTCVVYVCEECVCERERCTWVWHVVGVWDVSVSKMCVCVMCGVKYVYGVNACLCVVCTSMWYVCLCVVCVLCVHVCGIWAVLLCGGRGRKRAFLFPTQRAAVTE